VVEWAVPHRHRDERELTAVLPQELRELVESGPLTYLSTTNSDGSPQVTMMWIGLEGDDLVSAHMRENVKLRNIRRDPRVALSFGPPPVPGDWISPHVVIHATATVEHTAHAWALMARLAKVYVGPDAELPGGSAPGYIVRYSIDRIGGIGPWVTSAAP
jgi:PPOX class probable F420-dependent enzyme